MTTTYTRKKSRPMQEDIGRLPTGSREKHVYIINRNISSISSLIFYHFAVFFMYIVDNYWVRLDKCGLCRIPGCGVTGDAQPHRASPITNVMAFFPV